MQNRIEKKNSHPIIPNMRAWTNVAPSCVVASLPFRLMMQAIVEGQKHLGRGAVWGFV
jgi:hypothetical protein